MISVSPDLHLPIHRNALNSLTWEVWFSLTNSNLLMSWLPKSLFQKLLWVPLFPCLEQSFRAIWDTVSQGLSLEFCQPNKIRLSTFTLHAYFFSWQCLGRSRKGRNEKREAGIGFWLFSSCACIWLKLFPASLFWWNHFASTINLLFVTSVSLSEPMLKAWKKDLG